MSVPAGRYLGGGEDRGGAQPSSLPLQDLSESVLATAFHYITFRLFA